MTTTVQSSIVTEQEITQFVADREKQILHKKYMDVRVGYYQFFPAPKEYWSPCNPPPDYYILQENNVKITHLARHLLKQENAETCLQDLREWIVKAFSHSDQPRMFEVLNAANKICSKHKAEQVQQIYLKHQQKSAL